MNRLFGYHGVVLSAALVTTLLAGSATAATQPRALRKEIVIEAALGDVWNAWTTAEGLEIVSPKSNVDLRLGGPYEWFQHLEPDERGRSGGAGARILSFLDREMLAFDWTFPPSIPGLRSADARTQVVVRFTDRGAEGVHIRFVQHGWQEGEDWDAGFAYFDEAWDWVLGEMKTKLEQAAATRDAAPQDPPAVVGAHVRAWRDGHVEIEAIYGAGQRQDFAITIPVTSSEVWSLLATEEGLRRLGAESPFVELRLDGAYHFWPGSTNKVLAFLPGEMLSTSGSAPPKFPEVRKGGTWSVIRLAPSGEEATRLKMTLLGWRPGVREWDEAFDFFLQQNAVFLNVVYQVLVGDAAPGAEDPATPDP